MSNYVMLAYLTVLCVILCIAVLDNAVDGYSVVCRQLRTSTRLISTLQRRANPINALNRNSATFYIRNGTLTKYRPKIVPGDEPKSLLRPWRLSVKLQNRRKRVNGIPSVKTTEELLDAVKISNEERLQKVIAHAGLASRREAEKLILDGKVVVNGKVVTELGLKVKPKLDTIVVNKKKLILPDAEDVHWIAVNKPKSILSTDNTNNKKESIISIVPKAKEMRLLPVGGLDRDATGILIMTNDIGWLHPLTHPSFGHHARFQIVIKGLFDDSIFDKLRQSVILPGESRPISPSKIRIIDEDHVHKLTAIDVSIVETITNQVDKMMDAIGCELVRLKRTEFSTLKLGKLRKGAWREMTTSEIEAIKTACKVAIRGIESNSKQIAKNS